MQVDNSLFTKIDTKNPPVPAPILALLREEPEMERPKDAQYIMAKKLNMGWYKKAKLVDKGSDGLPQSLLPS